MWAISQIYDSDEFQYMWENLKSSSFVFMVKYLVNPRDLFSFQGSSLLKKGSQACILSGPHRVLRLEIPQEKAKLVSPSRVSFFLCLNVKIEKGTDLFC